MSANTCRLSASLHVSLCVFQIAITAASAQPSSANESPKSSSCATQFRVVLDVGHSKEIPGTVSARGRLEFTFNLRLANDAAAVLRKHGYKAVTVLVSDRGVSLLERARRANGLMPNLLLSIHHDSVQERYLKTWLYRGIPNRYSDRYNGFSIFLSQRNRRFPESARFALLLADDLLRSNMHFTLHHAENVPGEGHEFLDSSRGIYRNDDLVILQESRAPAVLFESGIIRNRDEELALSTPQRRHLIAEAIASAINKFCVEPDSATYERQSHPEDKP